SALVGGASTVEVRRLEGAAWSEAVALPGVAALRLGGGSLAFAPDGRLAVAWSGDGGLGDGSGAHVTVFGAGPRLAVPADHEPATADVVAAEPHDPPTFGPVQPGQGGAVRESSTGPDFRSEEHTSEL